MPKIDEIYAYIVDEVDGTVLNLTLVYSVLSLNIESRSSFMVSSGRMRLAVNQAIPKAISEACSP